MDHPRRSRGMLRRWVIRAGWVFVLTVSVWIAFGLLWKDNPATSDRVSGWVAFAALFSDAFRFHLGFPIGAMLLVAMAARGWKLSVALALLLIPTLGARLAMTPDRASGSEKPGQTITVFSANLLYGRGDDERLLEQIFANSPDLVLLQEYTPDEASLAAALRAEYPHSVKHPQNDAFGIALFSRLPFVEEPEVWRGPEESRKPMIACMVEVGGERIAVWNVHTLPPTGGNTTAAQRRMIGWIGEQARVVLNDPGGASGLVIAGDFNATSGSNHLREILAAGLVESHAKAGAGPGVTWPMRGLKRHFGGIRIDHIFVGGILSPASAWVGDDFGSDHLPVVARIVLAN